MKELVLIKLGGSVITDKSREFTSKENNILRLAKEIKGAQKVFKGKLIIGHGGGSFPHAPASKYQTKKGLINNKSLIGAGLVEDAARKLNMIVVGNFLSQNLPVFTFSPSSFLISDTLVCSKSYLDSLIKALEVGIIPIVYGDVVMDKSLGVTIFSTEKTLSVIAHKLNKDYKIRMIYVTNVNGVYDNKGKTIPLITNKNFNQIKTSILGSGGIDVTGGMLHKVEEALLLAKKYKIETLIINGEGSGNLQKAILGKKLIHTRII
jgi:isopentenyl phosphate kinase